MGVPAAGDREGARKSDLSSWLAPADAGGGEDDGSNFKLKAARTRASPVPAQSPSAGRIRDRRFTDKSQSASIPARCRGRTRSPAYK